jgi:hypothetical protein
MRNLIQEAGSAQQIGDAAKQLREIVSNEEFSLNSVLEIFEEWAAALQGREFDEIPGVSFLRLWLRRGTLDPILKRELGEASLVDGWNDDGRARLKSFPIGVVGHWPAGNIEIQPLLSMSCALLGGNGSLVRVPSGLVDITGKLFEKLQAVNSDGVLSRRIKLFSFDHSREDLQEAMARNVDGAMIWGGLESVSHMRGLPFPHWARIAVFGPRLSVAAMDAEVWNCQAERDSWCQRIARDVWQFEQQACSSPQVLFLERASNADASSFISELKQAFQAECRAHPRRELSPAMTSAICLARASWLLEDVSRRASFPASPDWTILVGSGAEIPKPTQGRTLSVLMVDDLLKVIEKFDGTVQTLGLAVADAKKEELLAGAAGRRGVDRIVKLGRMHVFGSPWDGVDLIRPMVRLVRHVPSQS